MYHFYTKVYSTSFLLFVFILTVTPDALKAQQIPQISQFMYNQLLYNPAAAGMQDTEFNTNLLGRFQWSGMEGAPMTNMLWADYKFSSKNMALGLNINRDSYGASSNTDVFANYAYYVPLSPKVKLSMGLRVGATFSRFSTTDLKRIWDPEDMVVLGAERSSTLPKAGAGFQLLTKSLYVGIAAPDIITVDKDNIYQKKKNYLLMGGYRWKVNDSYNLFPNLRMIYIPDGGMIADINLIAEITDYFWAGATYSTAKSYALMAGTHISSRIRFGYAFEFKSRSETSATLNTHEINLMINLDDLFRKNK